MPQAIVDLLGWMEDSHSQGGSLPVSDFEPSSENPLDYYFSDGPAEEANPEIKRLGVFAATGSGSMFAVWHAGPGQFPVVYLDSEGTPFQVLAADSEDFLLRLSMGHGMPFAPVETELEALPALQLGADASGPVDENGDTPNQVTFMDSEAANLEFRQWVEARAQTVTPETTGPIYDRLLAAGLPDFYDFFTSLSSWPREEVDSDATPFGLM